MAMATAIIEPTGCGSRGPGSVWPGSVGPGSLRSGPAWTGLLCPNPSSRPSSLRSAARPATALRAGRLACPPGVGRRKRREAAPLPGARRDEAKPEDAAATQARLTGAICGGPMFGGPLYDGQISCGRLCGGANRPLPRRDGEMRDGPQRGGKVARHPAAVGRRPERGPQPGGRVPRTARACTRHALSHAPRVGHARRLGHTALGRAQPQIRQGGWA